MVFLLVGLGSGNMFRVKARPSLYLEIVDDVLPACPMSETGEDGEWSQFPRIVWWLWFDGVDNAPDIVKASLASWQAHNAKTWNITVLQETNLDLYLPGQVPARKISPQARSDIIRLRLLSTRGGIWTDATVLCLRPLDDWLPAAIAPVGLWMYHGRDFAFPGDDLSQHPRGPASWFIAARNDSSLIRAWADVSSRFWSGGRIEATGRCGELSAYFWMDCLFHELLKMCPLFARAWVKVPHVSCEDPGEAHALANRVYEKVSPSLIHEVAQTRPHVLKLSHKKKKKKLSWTFRSP